MFYDQMFNPNFNNPHYYQQIQNQISQYQQEQDKEVYNAVKGFQDWCDAMTKLDQQHQQKAVILCLAELAKYQGWN